MRPRTVVLVYLLIVCWTLGPMACALTAGYVGNLLGCRVDEAGSHPCFVLGCDIGPILYILGVLGWLSLLTIPTGAIAFLLFSVLVLVTGIRNITDGR